MKSQRMMDRGKMIGKKIGFFLGGGAFPGTLSTQCQLLLSTNSDSSNILHWIFP